MEFCTLLRLVHVMNLLFINFYFVFSVFKGENPTYVIFGFLGGHGGRGGGGTRSKKLLTLACIQTFKDQFLSNLML